MKLVVDHRTVYAYDEEVQRSMQYVRLFPRQNNRQRINHWEVDMPGSMIETTDAYGNVLFAVTVEQPHRELAIRARGSVDVQPQEVASDSINPLYFLRTTRLSRIDPAMRDFAESYRSAAPRAADLERLMQGIGERMVYEVGSTQVDEPAAEAFAKGRGVCQDYVHIFLACCRYLGVPARYVSGYVFREERHNYSSHAWVEAWLEDGWRTFDVTAGDCSPARHLQLAIGLDYLEACPVRGVRWGGKGESMNAFAAVEKVELD